MSTLYLIRHGQASFGAANYDVLSPVGHTQAEALGRHWAQHAPPPDAIYCGPLERQRDTAEGMARGAREQGVTLPPVALRDALTEYPAIPMLRHWVPILEAEDANFRTLLTNASSEADRVQRAMEFIIGRWIRGELPDDGLESYRDFVGRVRNELQHIMAEQGRQRRVAVVTSGGPVGVAMQMALRLTDDIMMKVAWVVANGSVTELQYRDNETTLVRFNGTPHLKDPDLITFR